MLYRYFINLNERGDFYADIRNSKGKTVYEVKTDDLGVISQIEDGFISSVYDIKGLESYLKDIGVLKQNDLLTKGSF